MAVWCNRNESLEQRMSEHGLDRAVAWPLEKESENKQQLGSTSGEGNGNPLQYSCLENPVDGGAW